MTINSTLPLIKLVATGGTIAMKNDVATGGSVPAINGDELLAAVSGIADIARVEVESVFNLPSEYIAPEHWLMLYASASRALQRQDIHAVIVSHGTDTLEETAFFLDLTLQTQKPVILVGAQRDATELDSDGPRNLLDAVRVAVDSRAQAKGVLVVINQTIHAARDVRKKHTSNVAGFDSGELGFLGHIDAGKVSFSRSPKQRQHIPLLTKTLARVDIIAMYAGADGALLAAAVAAGAQGLVIQALGAGNVNKPMFEAIKSAIQQGVAVVISTRVRNGSVSPVYAYQGGGKTLADCGAILSGDLSPQKARVLLMLALQALPAPSSAASRQALQELFA